MQVIKLIRMAAAFAWLAAGARAAEPVHEFQPFEVTGSRVAPADGVAGAVWELDGLGASVRTRPADTWAALERVPGVQVEQPGGLAGNTVLYLNGGEPNFTKVIIDGIEVNNPNSSRGGTYNFNSISLAGIERIEVLAGAHSAVYGSDALSGVIRIQTLALELPPPGQSLDIGLEVGELGYRRAEGRAEVAGERYRAVAGAGHLEESNGLTGEAFEARRANAGLLLAAGARARVFLSALASDITRRHYPDDSGGWLHAEQPLLDHNASEDAGAQATGYFQLAEATELVAGVSWYRLEENDASPGVPPGERDPFGIPENRFDSVLERWKAQGYLRHRFSPRLALAAGAEVLDERGRSASLVRYPFLELEGAYQLETRTRSVFGEAVVSPAEHHQAAMAVRVDDIGGIGTVTTRRAAYRAGIPRLDAGLRLSWGEGFKKPSFFALGNPVVGNPALRPEESELLQLDLDWKSAGGRLTSRLGVFGQDFTNLIDLSESAPPRLVNLQSVTSRGVTAAAAWSQGRLQQLTVHATWLDIEVRDSDELLRNRPEWKLGLTAIVQLHASLFLDFHTLYIGRREDSSIPTGTVTLDAYVKSDLGLRWRAGNGLWLTCSIDNLWDQAYEAAVGMPDPGRRLRVGTRWIF